MTWTKHGGDFQDPPVGTHIARCIGIIDLGTQQSEYQGKTTIKRQNILRWELPTELIETGDAAGKPFIVSKFYTTNLNSQSNLYADLVNWRGRDFSEEELAGFEEKNLLDKICMLSLTKNPSGKVRATGIMAKPKTVECPPRFNELIYFSLEPDRFDRRTFEEISEGIKNIIRKSPEFAELNGTARPHSNGRGMPVDSMADDIPF